MAITIIQTNFTAGELSPRLLGRVDIARYQNAAEEMLNAHPVIHGGALRRAGTRFVAVTKDSTKRSALIPYVFNRDQAYILEAGDFYARVFKDRAQVELDDSPYEFATPYGEAVLQELDYCQGADTMFLAQQATPINRLQRYDHNDWRLMQAPFTVRPFDEIGTRAAIQLTLSDASAGTGRTLTAAAGFFLPADVGRDIWAGRGIATITAVASDTSATVTVIEAFSSTTLAANVWVLKGSPQAPCTPSAKDPVGQDITLTLGGASSLDPAKVITGLSWALNRATATIAGHGYSTGNTLVVDGNTPAEYNGTYSITVVDANTFWYTLTPNPGPATVLGSAARSNSGAVGGWRSTDVDSYVRINGGLTQITSVVSTSVAHATIKTALSSAITSQTNAWILQSSIWNSRDGYPRTVTLCDQRLYAAGSPGFPQTVVASRIGEALNFELWTNADDALSFTVDSNQVNPVAYLVQVRALLALTYGGEFTLSGGGDQPITPTNISVKNQSPYGCAQVKPLRVGNELMFVERGGRHLRAMSYQLTDDGYKAPDISVLAEHLTQSGIKQMAFQQSPDSIIWMVRNDGVLVSVTYDRDQDVIGWARHVTDGLFESVACIPGDEGDDVYVIVNRTIEGNTVRCIEVLDSSLNTDSAITGESPEGGTIWGGLDHLEGKTVDIVADGVVMPPKVVVDGTIEIERPAFKIEVGLHYQSRIKMLTPEVPTPTGSAQGNNMRISEVTVRLLDSIGCEINGEIVPFRKFGEDVLDNPVQPFSGDKRVDTFGWERGTAKVVIEQNQPLPLHVLAVIRKFTVNG